MQKLKDYGPIAGEQVVEETRLIGSKLAGIRFRHVNSTAVGGGVAEILTRMVPLMQEMGIEATWEVMKGDDAFFEVTKSMHNGLQGFGGEFTESMRETYQEAQQRNRSIVERDADVTIIHDPQPAGLLTDEVRGAGRWVWRCHIDMSHSNESYWGFLRPIVSRYDAGIFSSPKFVKDYAPRKFIIPPSIDPFSDKNRELEPDFIRSTLEKYSIDPTRSVITQVSRFDAFKDPLGVIESYRAVKKTFDVQLVLAGGTADDDPEGAVMLQRVREAASHDKDIHVLCLPPTAHLEINALQRASTIVLQKSLREGFALTVTEALWKGKPVIAGAVGGITQQIKHKLTGILVNSVDGAAYYIKYLLANPDLASTLARNGREHVRQNYLLIRHLRDYLVLAILVLTRKDGLVLLDQLSLR